MKPVSLCSECDKPKGACARRACGVILCDGCAARHRLLHHQRGGAMRSDVDRAMLGHAARELATSEAGGLAS